MFRKAKVEEKKSIASLLGGAEIIFCVFDEKRRLSHSFCSSRSEKLPVSDFKPLQVPERAFECGVLREAAESCRPASMAFTYGGGHRTFFHVLPYERKRAKWFYACLQITASLSPDDPAYHCALADEGTCLLLADAEETILSASANMEEIFGYSLDVLKGIDLADLFNQVDFGMITACSSDLPDSILSCAFRCRDGSRKDVEVQKYSAPGNCHLYCICDVTRPHFNEEITQVTTRERRRIGQDLHDSIGQLLTGISLLSRSLANALRRVGHPGDTDAAQISELADDASNQIRQISRGLMPTDIVHCGLHSALRHLAKITTETCGLICDTQLDESVRFSDGAVETHLFRIAQEAVNNAVRHANASRIDIIILRKNDLPLLLIQDNGQWRNIMENGGGIGLKTMQYRTSAINGRFRIGKTSAGGTVVECRLEQDDSPETRA